MKKFSRTLTPGSRTPSMKMSLRASKPRMKKRSPKALPPSPVPSVTPAVYRIACFSVVAFLSSSTSLLSTVTVFGVFEQRLGKLARRLQMIDLVGRGRVRIGIAIRAQACRHWETAPAQPASAAPPGRTAQRIARADLIGCGLGRSGTRASGRGIDRSPAGGWIAALRRRRDDATAMSPATAETFLPE